jgi:GxxExxY protein
MVERVKGRRKPGRMLYGELGYQVQGALKDVHNTLGPGFREQTYQRAVMKALQTRGIPFETEKVIDITYAGEVIDQYRLDLVVDGKIVLELKAVNELQPRDEAQLLSYLRASGLRLGLLVNFGSNKLNHTQDHVKGT